MGVTAYLAKDVGGKEVPIPLQNLLHFLRKYGVDADGTGECHFPPFNEDGESLCDYINIVSSDSGDAAIIAMGRPIYNELMREFIFSAMQEFGLNFFDDGSDELYCLSGFEGDVSKDLVEKGGYKVVTIKAPDELWAELT